MARNDTGYHEKMCALAEQQYEGHILVPHENNDRLQQPTRREPWMLKNPTERWSNPTEIRPIAFGRLLVHGACEPVVWGNYDSPPGPWKHHPIVDLIGRRDARYLDYVLKKTIPRIPPYYDQDKAYADLSELFHPEDPDDLVTLNRYNDEDHETVEGMLMEHISNEDWHSVQRCMYEELEIETEDIGRLGRVLAPPNFYYAVFAVKKLWELLEAG